MRTDSFNVGWRAWQLTIGVMIWISFLDLVLISATPWFSESSLSCQFWLSKKKQSLALSCSPSLSCLCRLTHIQKGIDSICNWFQWTLLEWDSELPVQDCWQNREKKTCERRSKRKLQGTLRIDPSLPPSSSLFFFSLTSFDHLRPFTALNDLLDIFAPRHALSHPTAIVSLSTSSLPTHRAKPRLLAPSRH